LPLGGGRPVQGFERFAFMAEVRLKDVVKIYPGNIKAVDDFNLDVHDNEFVVLVGPSGCGKSTTLRMVAGLEEITRGSIYIGDRLVNDVPPKDRDIAMVFQNYALYPHMTCYQNMAFGLKLRRFPKPEIDARVREAAEILGITELLDRKPKALSGGQRQRVAVGRAIVRKPKVFLFDEPLSNLDAKLRVQMRSEISKLHSRLRATMIYVTHDQVEAMTMGDRIVVMNEGLIQQVDEPIALYDTPANRFVARFIGSPPMNIFDGRVESENGRLFFNQGACRIQVHDECREALGPYVDKPVAFGCRPEALYPPQHFPQGHPSAKIAAKVEVIEPMGSEQYLYLTAGHSAFVARVDPHYTVSVDDQVELLIDMKKTHFFEAEGAGRIIC